MRAYCGTLGPVFWRAGLLLLLLHLIVLYFPVSVAPPMLKNSFLTKLSSKSLALNDTAGAAQVVDINLFFISYCLQSTPPVFRGTLLLHGPSSAMAGPPTPLRQSCSDPSVCAHIRVWKRYGSGHNLNRFQCSYL